MPINEWQQRTLDRFVAEAPAEPAFRAVILGGSIAHGFSNDYSDVDVMVVTSSEDAARRKTSGTATVWIPNEHDEPYRAIDAKYIDEPFIREVAARGSEPARYAFEGATVVWSRVEGLDDLVAEASAYPEAGVEERIARFHGQLGAAQWFVQQAHGKGNEYLARWGSCRAVLFACRMILAHNRALYPFHKWMLAATERLPDRPPELMDLCDRAVREATEDAVNRLVETVVGFRDWPEWPGGWGPAFMHDTEQLWLRAEPAIEDI